MKRASKLLSTEEKAAVEKAVADAETKTSGEIVPVIASASGRYDRAEDLFGVFCALVLLVVLWLAWQGVEPSEGDWVRGQRIQYGLIPILLTVLIGFAGGALAATVWPVLRLPFVTRGEMEAEVERAAGEAFHRFRVRGTRGTTGILIYVSLHERMVRILGDDAISRRVAQSDWDIVRDALVSGLRGGKPAEAMIAAIEKAGVILADQFPIEPDDVNELPNELRLID